jgi:hypothetical protein
MAWSSPAFAQSTSSDTALAEELYQQGKRLMSEGHHAEACPKLAESQRLAPGMGTLLTLAVCHEGEGKLASAWAEFTEVLPAARRANRQDRAQYAEQHIAALAPRLSRLKIIVPSDAQLPGLVVQLNAAPVSAAALGVAAPVDGGTFTVTASAPEKQSWSQQIVVKPEKDQQAVTIPILPPRRVAETAAAPPSSQSAPLALAGTESAPSNVSMETRPAPRWPLYVAVGATAALAAGATVTGIIALGHASDFKDANRNPSFTQQERQSLRDNASTMGTVSTVLAAGAVAAGAASLYLFFTRPTSSPNAQGWRVVPFAAPTVAGLQLVGAQ